MFRATIVYKTKENRMAFKRELECEICSLTLIDREFCGPSACDFFYLHDACYFRKVFFLTRFFHCEPKLRKSSASFVTDRFIHRKALFGKIHTLLCTILPALNEYKIGRPMNLAENEPNLEDEIIF